PDGDMALVGCGGGELMLYDLATGNPLHIMKGHAFIQTILTSTDGSVAICAGRDAEVDQFGQHTEVGSFRVWSLMSGRCLYAGRAGEVCLTPDGQAVVCCQD